MKKSGLINYYALGLFVLTCGVAAGVRAIMLSRVFDSHTGLAEPNHPLTWTLLGLTVLAALLAVLVHFSDIARYADVKRVLLIAAAVALGASGFLDIIDMIRGAATLTQVALAGLGLLSAVCVLMLAASKNASKLTMGLFATVPIFWGGFWFLTIFAKNASNPVVIGYICDFLAVLFYSLCAGAFAGFFFGQIKKKRLTLTCCMAVFFLFVSLGSPIAAMTNPNALSDGVTAAGALRLIFAVLYVLSIPAMAEKAIDMPDEEDTDDAENQPV